MRTKNRTFDIEALQQLWETFHDLMESLRSLPGTAAYKNEETFQKEAMEWASNFRKQTFDEDVIPYIHGKSILMILYILIVKKNCITILYNHVVI